MPGPEEEVGSQHDPRHDESVRPRDVRRDDGRCDPLEGDGPGSAIEQHHASSLGERWEPPSSINIADPVREPSLPDLTPGQIHRQVRIEEYTDGLIPPPTMLGLYGEVDVTLPTRIVAMAEQDQRARIEVERRSSRAEAFSVMSGAIVAPLLIIGLVVISFVLFWNGNNGGAATAMVTGLTVWLTPAVVESLGRRKSSSPAASKAPPPKSPSPAKQPPATGT